MAPDILQYKEELVQRVKDSLDHKVCCVCLCNTHLVQLSCVQLRPTGWFDFYLLQP